MDSHFTAFAVVIFATSCVLSGCLSEQHLVPKHGLESNHRIAKRDLSPADMEMILKELMLKLDHKEPERAAKVHYTDVKESEMKYASKSHPEEYEYVKETFPKEKDVYEMEKDVDAEEKEMKAFSMKLKELGIGKDIEESYGKEIYLDIPEEKFVQDKEHLLKDLAAKEQSEKALEDVLKDKFNDKEVSIAESLYHMKIAGDVETYPHIKMEPLHEMKKADEKLHLEKIGAEETFLKKVDELGKTILKEDHLKEGDIEAYLKKIVEEEKVHLYEPKKVHAESHIKGAEEKALEAWKDSHKDIFIAEEEFLDEKLKKEAAHHKEEGIAVGINEELIKKIKTFDEDLAKEHDELLHTLAGKGYKDEMIAEGTTAYEKAKEQAHKDAHIHLTDEELKKYIDALAFGAKEKGFNIDMLFGKGLSEEKVHGIDGKIKSGIDKSLHGIAEEEVFKSKEASALDKAYGFEMEKAKSAGKIPLMEEGFKHAVSHEIADETKKAFKIGDEELFKKEIAHGTDALLHKGHEEEFLKKEKSLGTDAFLHKAAEEEFIKKGEAFGKDAFFHKAHEEDLIKEKGYAAEDSLHKLHEDELLKKEKAFDIDAFLHKIHEEELLKKEKSFGADAFLHKAHEDELLKKGKAFGVEADLHKAHEDELIKKEIAYGTDIFLHKDKDIAAAAEEHHEKSHKTIHDLKAKFFELLRRVLHTRKCYLVTMRPGELLGIVNCISRSKNPLLCEKFAMCEKKMPPRVIAILEKCQKETIPGEVKTCTKYAPLYPSTEIPVKIFQCVAVNARELKPEEKKMMIEFEECARVVKAESCARFKFFPH